MTNSTTTEKPSRPKGFPLFAHATGRWAKKVKGKLHYFGPWREPEAALQSWLDQKDDLLGGRTPRRGQGVTCRESVNAFLTSKQMLADAGTITWAHWFDYKATCARVLDCFGKVTPVDTLRANDFDKLQAAIAKVYGPTALGNEIQRVRSLFKWGYDTELLVSPVRFGPDFRRPSKKIRRLVRHAAGPRLFTAAELRQVLDKAESPLTALILMGINTGMGQSDLASMPVSRLDLDRGWHSFERQKTGIARHCPLWPETVQALRVAIANRPAPGRRKIPS